MSFDINNTSRNSVILVDIRCFGFSLVIVKGKLIFSFSISYSIVV